MRTLRLLGLLVATTLLLSLPLAAQKFENVPEAQPTPTQATGAPAGVKIGVINIQAAMARTQEGQKAAQELEARFSPRQAELQKLQEEIAALEEKLRTQERTLSDDARLQAMRDLEQKRKEGTRKQQDLQDDAQDAQTTYVQQIGSKMQQIIDRYARENGLNVIFNVSPGGPVIYATAAVDITEAIIRLYDQTHPVETAGGAKPNPSARTNPPPKP
ncbi:MAG TPA: OmpH family outer membrane protein [Candidatus Acidoferrales bacterium]|nr:OmpH family outer membrane protein [Candidatus Acidoferrales bacterium]